MSLGEPGDTHNFAFPTLGIGVTLEVGDVILFDPCIFHGCESMEGFTQVLVTLTLTLTLIGFE